MPAHSIVHRAPAAVPATSASVGDVVEIPAGVEHRYGAGARTPLQHLAIQPDAATDWRDPVDEAEFANAGGSDTA